jgi:hypothetical protein
MRVEGLKSLHNFDKDVFLEDAHDYCENHGKAIEPSLTTAAPSVHGYDEEGEELASDGKRIGKRKKKKRRGGVMKRGSSDEITDSGEDGSSYGDITTPNNAGGGENPDAEEELLEEEESSIFGQTVGSGNATWVECDRCKKVRFDVGCFTYVVLLLHH